MNLLRRIAVLLKADAHGVVESLEDRQLLLKQYLREGEIELDRNRARLEALDDEVKALKGASQCEAAAVQRLDEDVSLALAGGRDDLARFAIRRLLSHRAAAAEIAAQIDERQEQLALMTERVEAQQRRYGELEQRARAEFKRHSVSERGDWEGVGAVADEEVEIELMRRRGVEVVR